MSEPIALPAEPISYLKACESLPVPDQALLDFRCWFGSSARVPAHLISLLFHSGMCWLAGFQFESWGKISVLHSHYWERARVVAPFLEQIGLCLLSESGTGVVPVAFSAVRIDLAAIFEGCRYRGLALLDYDRGVTVFVGDTVSEALAGILANKFSDVYFVDSDVEFVTFSAHGGQY